MSYTEEELQVLYDCHAYMHQHNRTQAIKSLFRANAFDDEYTEFPRHLRIFYWIKTLLCLLANRTGGSYIDSRNFCITFWDMKPSVGEYSGYDWQSCGVNTGIFTGWTVSLYSDSSY